MQMADYTGSKEGSRLLPAADTRGAAKSRPEGLAEVKWQGHCKSRQDGEHFGTAAKGRLKGSYKGTQRQKAERELGLRLRPDQKAAAKGKCKALQTQSKGSCRGDTADSCTG